MMATLRDGLAENRESKALGKEKAAEDKLYKHEKEAHKGQEIHAEHEEHKEERYEEKALHAEEREYEG